MTKKPKFVKGALGHLNDAGKSMAAIETIAQEWQQALGAGDFEALVHLTEMFGQEIMRVNEHMQRYLKASPPS